VRTKKLEKNTVCAVFPIKAPQWNGKRPHVGLNISRLTPHNEITIEYTRKSDGERTWPDTYYYDGTTRDQYKVQTWKGVELLLVPISDLQVLQRVDKELEPGSIDELLDWLHDGKYATSIEELNNQGGESKSSLG
jgi:hypothetical protein